VSWDEGKRIASALGGRLACLEDEAAIDFAKKTWPGKTYFLGASRSGNAWTWLSGTAMKNAPWETGQPSTSGNPCGLRAGDKGWTEATADIEAGILVEWTK